MRRHRFSHPTWTIRQKMLIICRPAVGVYTWSCRSCGLSTGRSYPTEAAARRAYRTHRAWKCPLTGDKK